MQNITFKREPAVWIGLIAAVLVAFVQSGVSPEVTANAGGYSALITLLAGVAIRFFVTPTASLPNPAPAAAATAATPPAVPPASA